MHEMILKASNDPNKFIQEVLLVINKNQSGSTKSCWNIAVNYNPDKDLKFIKKNLVITLKNIFLSNSLLVNKIFENINLSSLKQFFDHFAIQLLDPSCYDEFYEEHVYEMLTVFFHRYIKYSMETNIKLYYLDIKEIFKNVIETLIETKFSKIASFNEKYTF